MCSKCCRIAKMIWKDVFFTFASPFAFICVSICIFLNCSPWWLLCIHFQSSEGCFFFFGGWFHLRRRMTTSSHCSQRRAPCDYKPSGSFLSWRILEVNNAVWTQNVGLVLCWTVSVSAPFAVVIMEHCFSPAGCEDQVLLTVSSCRECSLLFRHWRLPQCWH